MDDYTNTMGAKAYEAAEDYYPEEKIREAAKMFRTFSQALDDFIKNHGYAGNMEDADEKAAFIRKTFERAGVPLPRGIKEWYTKGKGVSRVTGFQICFAFGLDKEGTDDFFRRVMLSKSFDCHVMEEAVYYFCMRNGKDYREAERILKASPAAEITDVTKSRIAFGGDILYTSMIMKELDRFKYEAELLAYFRKNVEKFGYHHVTATEELQILWARIRKKQDGLADREKTELQKCGIRTEEARSVSEILRQILGLDEVDEEKRALFVLKSDRSLKPILKDNPLLPDVAQKQFPGRQTLENILKGKHVDPESIRKNMVLTYFYYFWIKKALKLNDRELPDTGENKKTSGNRWLDLTAYRAEPGDDERFVDDMNKRLLEAGYPELYLGNPYDWIFIYCSRSEEPLMVFREFIHEMYLEKEEYIMEINNQQKEG